MSRDEEIEQVARMLEGMLDELVATEKALREILTRPPDGGEQDERVVAQ